VTWLLLIWIILGKSESSMYTREFCISSMLETSSEVNQL